MNYKILSFSLSLCAASSLTAQAVLTGKLLNENKKPVIGTVSVAELGLMAASDSTGTYRLSNLPFSTVNVEVSAEDYLKRNTNVKLSDSVTVKNFSLAPRKEANIDEVVISGTMKPVHRLESPVPVEVYTPTYFKKNPTPSIFEALQLVNGVRPQLNCNVCNTGDIHINGLEGPYTMVLIDGMPIVSSLGTVYGLSGIPNSLVERIEVVKGPASSLYGSEAVGGLINIITKKAENANRLSLDALSSTWGEYNLDGAFKFKAGKKVDVLTGVNYFVYDNPIDNNHDNFTDVTLQNRISVFQKWNFQRKENRLFSLAARYLYEDRWGGDMRWNKSYRGGNVIYGESIYTNRAELIGNYQLPMQEKMFFSFSLIDHDQDSRYGESSYIANQKIAFGQLTWDKKIGRHDLLAGAALRYTYYDDNTPATATELGANEPENTWLPGLFVQDEISLSDAHKLLLGFRYDHNNIHGSIYTPRMAYKWAINPNSIFRLNAGTGFRVVNLFTEDHAALTGARQVVILNDLKPEKSYNANLNFIQKFYFNSGKFLNLEASAFYTYFTNRIVPDYETNPHQIIYDNLEGHAVSKGISLNTDLNFASGLKFILGATLMNNTITEDGVTSRQLLAENFTGTWAVSYRIKPIHISVDYTGNVYSPMPLPLLGPLDPRKPDSPWWSIQNIQFTFDGMKNFEIYGGVKNLLNWTPNRGNPFIISGTDHPFDEDPDGLPFDTSYVYGPNQGIRGFLGIRYNFR